MLRELKKIFFWFTIGRVFGFNNDLIVLMKIQVRWKRRRVLNERKDICITKFYERLRISVTILSFGIVPVFFAKIILSSYRSV